MFAYDPSEWHDLFVATAGAGAALAGLVFVAVSINVDRILQFKGLPERALQTVLVLLSVVVTSVIGLVPGQDNVALGLELLVFGSASGGVIWTLAMRSMPDIEGSEPRVWRLVILGWATVPTLIGAISILAESGGGLYWIVLGIVGALISSVVNAWVLLVEILR
jgi:modulator of FtsH protease